MKRLLPEALGTAGYGLLCGGLYVVFGTGVAMCVGGTLLMVGGYYAAKAVRR